MDTEISLLSKKEFIDASRDFVCVRLGTLESKDHQDMVRSLLRGTFQNTAFVVFAPDGETKLTRSGRGPKMAFSGDPVTGMKEIAYKYKQKGAIDEAEVGDFHSFKQSLNVSSADQRLLLFTVGDQEKILRKTFNDKDLIGRFHFDQAGKEDASWSKQIEGATEKQGHFIIQSGTFGTDGKVLAQLPIDSSAEDLKKALLKANKEFAQSAERKIYADHIVEGHKKGVSFENAMPPGEDRDGDGKIDEKPRRGR